MVIENVNRLFFGKNLLLLFAVALKDSKLKLDEQFVVYPDLEGFRTIDWPANLIRILKLHGGVDRPEELAVTVSKIADRAVAETLGTIINRIFAVQTIG